MHSLWMDGPGIALEIAYMEKTGQGQGRGRAPFNLGNFNFDLSWICKESTFCFMELSCENHQKSGCEMRNLLLWDLSKGPLFFFENHDEHCDYYI